MACKITPSSISGNIKIPPSKSQTLRALLFATLAEGISTIDNLLESADATSMINACKALDAKVSATEAGVSIKGVAGQINPLQKTIDVGNSGIVLRFISAIAALSPTPITLTGDHSVCHQRPMHPLLGALHKLGVRATSLRNNGYAPVVIYGPPTSTRTTVIGRDSQPVSSLLILGAVSPRPLEIQVIDPGELPWVKLTLDWLDFLKVPYERESFYRYQIGGGIPLQSFHYFVPGDMSSAAFAVTAAVIKGTQLVVHGLDFSDGQGDKQYFDILKRMGGRLNISPEEKTITVLPGSQLVGVTEDINHCIDAICILAVAACFAEGETRLTNASIARTKECNRIAALVKELSKMGANIEETDDGLKIKGTGLKGANVDSHGDHRMAMSLIVAAMGATGTTSVNGIDCIGKTYPSFISDFTNLGALIDEYRS